MDTVWYCDHPDGEESARCFTFYCVVTYVLSIVYIQSNLNSPNTIDTHTVANSNSLLSPDEILSIAPENKYLWKFSYFIMKLYVVCIH